MEAEAGRAAGVDTDTTIGREATREIGGDPAIQNLNLALGRKWRSDATGNWRSDAKWRSDANSALTLHTYGTLTQGEIKAIAIQS